MVLVLSMHAVHAQARNSTPRTMICVSCALQLALQIVFVRLAVAFSSASKVLRRLLHVALLGFMMLEVAPVA